MTFIVGEAVVYSHHGAAVIEEITTRIIGGVEREYLKLRATRADLTIQIPSENAGVIGVHGVVDKEGLKHVFEVLRTTKTKEPSNWSHRYKANIEKIATGDVVKMAEVIRGLSRRGSKEGLFAGKKRMLSKARQILVSELALAEKTNEEDALNRPDRVLTS